LVFFIKSSDSVLRLGLAGRAKYLKFVDFLMQLTKHRYSDFLKTADRRDWNVSGKGR
jgi:hypothetical protein